ncbi:hypothetical protein PMAYCL1PPCAC_24946, partial [Pristionchus mayeri]
SPLFIMKPEVKVVSSGFRRSQSPPRKIMRTDETVMKITPPDGVIRFEVSSVSSMMTTKDVAYAPNMYVRGVPWMASVYHGRHLHFALKCRLRESRPWSVDLEADFTLFHSDPTKNITAKIRQPFSYKDETTWRYTVDDEFFNPENNEGFIKDDKYTIEVRFWVSNMRGTRFTHRSRPRIDFDYLRHSHHDVVLVVGEEKIYACKGILAVHSSFFNELFFGEHSDKNKSEFELDDVDREEFIELLNVIYPSNNKITVDSAEYLLKLGDRYKIMVVVDRVVNFLIDSDAVSPENKLRIADKYKLSELQKKCLSSLRRSDFTRIEESAIFKNLSDAMKLAFYERHFSLFNRYSDRYEHSPCSCC